MLSCSFYQLRIDTLVVDLIQFFRLYMPDWLEANRGWISQDRKRQWRPYAMLPAILQGAFQTALPPPPSPQ